MIIKQTEEQIGIILACQGTIREHACGELAIEQSAKALINAIKPLQPEDY